MELIDLSKYVNRSGAAIILGVCSAMVYKLTRNGKLPFISVSGCRYYPVDQLQAIKQNRDKEKQTRKDKRYLKLGPKTKLALTKALLVKEKPSKENKDLTNVFLNTLTAWWKS